MFKNFLLSIFAIGGLSVIVLTAIADDSKNTVPEPEKAATVESAPESAAPAASVTPEGKKEPTPLSVEPGVGPSTIFIPPGRPAWVESQADHKSAVHKIAISSGPYVQRRDCLQSLDADLQRTVSEYIEEYLGAGEASKLVHYDLRTIKDRLVAGDVYEEDIEVSIGPMHQVHALVKFDKPFRDELDQRWHEIKATSRLLQAGLFGGSLIGLLGLAFGYLKLDTATRGYYTGRLQFGAVAAVLALAGAGVLLSRFIPWM